MWYHFLQHANLTLDSARKPSYVTISNQHQILYLLGLLTKNNLHQSITKGQILAWPKLKAFVDDKFNPFPNQKF